MSRLQFHRPVFNVCLFLVLCVSPLVIAAENFKDWIRSPEAYYATPEERQAWARIGTAQDAEKFKQAYWMKRGEAFQRDVQRRIEFAESKFSLGDLRGSKSARGRVWMILGAPSKENVFRTTHSPSQQIGALQTHIAENAKVRTEWIYRSDRLPKELGVPELKVIFVTDLSRGFEGIDNPAAVEPYLKRAAAHYSNLGQLPSFGASAPAVAPEPAIPSGDPLWNSESDPNGAGFTSGVFHGIDQKPYLAFQFYLPGDLDRFKTLNDAVFVGLVKDSSGKEVVAVREKISLEESGRLGDRSLEKSIVLEPGKYTGVLALFNPETGLPLTRKRLEFELAPPSTSLQLSQPVMTADIVPITGDSRAFDPFVFSGTKYVPKGSLRFRVNEKVGYFVVINKPVADPDPSVTLRMTVYKDGQPFARTSPAPAVLVQVGPASYLNANAFDAGAFPPGKYKMILQYRDAKDDSESGKRGLAATTEFEVTQN